MDVTTALLALQNLKNKRIYDKELADAIGMLPQNLARKKKDGSKLTAEQINKIESHFGVSLNQKSMKYNINTSNSGNRVKKMLLSLGLSQTELATKLNISRQRMSNIATGNGDFTDEQRILLCKLYNVNLNWLIAGVGEPFIHEQPKFEGDLKASILAEVEEMLKDLGITKD